MAYDLNRKEGGPSRTAATRRSFASFLFKNLFAYFYPGKPSALT
jgi:hypothetical protein